MGLRASVWLWSGPQSHILISCAPHTHPPAPGAVIGAMDEQQRREGAGSRAHARQLQQLQRHAIRQRVPGVTHKPAGGQHRQWGGGVDAWLCHINTEAGRSRRSPCLGGGGGALHRTPGCSACKLAHCRGMLDAATPAGSWPHRRGRERPGSRAQRHGDGLQGCLHLSHSCERCGRAMRWRDGLNEVPPRAPPASGGSWPGLKTARIAACIVLSMPARSC